MSTVPRGFTITELIVAIGVGGLVLAVIAAQSSQINQQRRTLQQRAQRAEVTHEITRALDQAGVCECNVKDLTLTGAGAVGVRAIFPAARALTTTCGGGPTLAKANQPLVAGGYAINVTRVLIDEMQPLDGTFGHATKYLGNITVELDAGGSVADLRPIKLARVFYVKGSSVVGCGPPNHAFTYAASDPVTNDLNGVAVAVARCPPTTRLIGGGFGIVSGDMPPGCQVGAYTNETLSSFGDRDNAWKVLARCRTIVARAVCEKLVPD